MNLDSPRTLLRRQAAAQPDRIALEDREARVTYGQLDELVALEAERLKEAGFGPGSQVGVALPNSRAFVVAYFAVLHAGGIVVPLAQNLSPDEAANLVSSAQLTAFYATDTCALPAATGASRFETDGIAPLWRCGCARASSDTGLDAPMLRQFSSGSTGRPKHMLKTARNVAHDALHVVETLRLGADVVSLGVAPFHHAYGALGFLVPLHAGGCVHPLPRFLPGPVLETALRARPTLMFATPPMLELLADARLEPGEDVGLATLAHCITSAGRLSDEGAGRFEARFGIQPKIQYGSTESLSATIDLDTPYDERRAGRPYAGMEVAVFGPGGEVLPPGERGRVGIRGPSVCAGYVDGLGDTGETFVDGWVFPGDTGYLDADDRLFVLGRDDVINIGGDKVDPLQVESVISDALPVRAVIVLAGERAGQPVVRAVVEADPEAVTRADVVAACRARLSAHKVPALVEIRAELPRNETGKVLRASLLKDA